METQIYFGSCVKEACCDQAVHGEDTLHTLFRMLAWSLSACLYNRHPVLDWNHQPWGVADVDRAAKANQKLNPEDFRFAIVGVCADLDELCNEYTLALVQLFCSLHGQPSVLIVRHFYHLDLDNVWKINQVE